MMVEKYQMMLCSIYEIMAVRRRSGFGLSPELIAKAYHFNRACIYRWLKQYDEGGYDALESRMPPGAERLINAEMDSWLKQTVLKCTPTEFGYDTNLWTSAILADLLNNLMWR